MRNSIRVLSVLLLLATSLPSTLYADTYHTHTLVRITTKDKADKKFVRSSIVDITGTFEGGFEALVTDEELAMLSASGLRVEIQYAEMAEDRMRWADADASHGLVTSYYTASTFNMVNPPVGSLMEHLLQLHNAHPTITRLYKLGASQNGLFDIIAMKVTKNPTIDEPEPKTRIYGNIHGDEKGGCMVAADVLDTILAGYVAVPQNATAKKLVDEAETWFIPMGNPSGNANSSRYNSNGVDLNRNFWGPAGSDEPPAWSESETRAIRDLTETATADHSKKRFAISLSFHEGAANFNSLWNYTPAAPSDEPIFWASRSGGTTGCNLPAQQIPNCPVRAPHGLAKAYEDGCTKNGFWYTDGYDWYGTRGDTNDWAYGAWTQLDTTIELNTTKTPSPSQIPIYTAEHRQAVLNYMMKVFQGIHGLMTNQNTGAPIDGTVTATATASATISVPHDYQAVFTDPVTGDFHRVLQPGTYTIVCNAPGYSPTTVTGVVVTADTATYANCVMNPTALAYGSSAMTDTCGAGGGSPNDGVLDAGESAVLAVTLNNPGSVAATNVQGTLTTNAPGVSITDATSDFGNVPGGGTGASFAPHFGFIVDASVACGTTIPFALHMTSDQGAWEGNLSVAVGQVSGGTPQALLTESFDGVSFPPIGWAQVDIAGTTGNWARATDTVRPSGGGTHSGAGLAYFNSYDALDGSTTRLYRTSGVAIPGSAQAASVTFWMYHETGFPSDPDQVQVQVSTNGTTWNNVGSAVVRNDGSTGWKSHSISIAAYIGQNVRVGLLGVSSFGNNCNVDDVQVTYSLPPSCAMTVCDVAPSADLGTTMMAPATVATGQPISYELGVQNGGPSSSTAVQLATGTPAHTTFVSMTAPPGWLCAKPAVGGTGSVACSIGSLAAGAPANFVMVVKTDWCVGDGVPIAASASVTSGTGDPDGGNDVASTNTLLTDNGGCDDGAACTSDDTCVGNACSGTPGPPPDEVGDVVLVARTGNDAVLTWSQASGATASSVLRGRLNAFPVGSAPTAETCIASGVAGLTATDSEVPGVGSGFWYLVRGESACGDGPYGYQGQNGVPTVLETSSACP